MAKFHPNKQAAGYPGLRRLARGLVTGAKWLIAVALMLEIASFLTITLSNYWIYGQLRDGERVNYDPYALFITDGYPRRTLNNPPQPVKGRDRIFWLFGGSTMAGATDHDDRTIPSFLAGVLNQEEPRLPAYLINFGEPSFNSLMETKYLQKALIERRAQPPEVIIFYDGANDATYFAQTRMPNGGHLGYEKVQGLIESYSHSFFGIFKPLYAALYASFTHELYDKINQGVIAIMPDAPSLQQFVDAVEARYDYVNQSAAGAGARFLLVWQPCWWVETAPVASEVKKREEAEIILGRHFALRHNFEVINHALVARLREKPYFLDFQNVLCGRKELAYQSDGIHLLDAGRKMVAARLGQVIKERFSESAAWGGSSR